jgi:hypothetical protein
VVDKQLRTDISYSVIRKQCLEAIKLWPGCETVAGIRLICNGSKAGFSLRVTLTGTSRRIAIHRATACVEREMRRRYRLAE